MTLRGTTGGSLGTAAPPLELPNAAGERKSLEEFRGRPVMLSFLGPAHCAFCRGHVIRMIQARDEIARANTDVVLVAFHDPELLMAKMLHDLELPYVLLLDRSRQAYARWGLGRAGLKSVLSPGLYWASLKLFLKREPSMGTTPHYNQLGGDFVVDRAGKLVFVNRMRSFYDRATVPDMLAALRQP